MQYFLGVFSTLILPIDKNNQFVRVWCSRIPISFSLDHGEEMKNRDNVNKIPFKKYINTFVINFYMRLEYSNQNFVMPN